MLQGQSPGLSSRGTCSVSKPKERFSVKRVSDYEKFDQAIGTKFLLSTKGFRVPNPEKVPINRIMLVCQGSNGTDVKYSDSDGFGCPGIMGLWDLHSSDALNRAKLTMSSRYVDANFCPMCSFWATNNETLNNHVHKHYNMGLLCRKDGFMKASVGAMKQHMETEHGFESKQATKKNKEPVGKS